MYEHDMDLGLEAAHDLSLSFDEIGLAMPESPEEIRSWEDSCHRALSDLIESLSEGPSERKYLAVELDGSFPDTVIEIRYEDASDGGERVRRCELWKGIFSEYAGLEPPSEVARMIHTHLLGTLRRH